MNYAQCISCGLSLPMTVLVPIIIVHQGKKIRVPICETCKEKKEKEAQRGQNENT